MPVRSFSNTMAMWGAVAMKSLAILSLRCVDKLKWRRVAPFLCLNALAAEEIAAAWANKLSHEHENSDSQISGKNPYQPLRHF